MTPQWDCVIVGGGAAGLSAGLVLGRARRRTLLLDVGGQSNLAAEGIGGLLGNDQRPPAEFYAAGREELAVYDAVELRDAEALRGERRPDGFALELGDGSEVATRTVLLATGMEYRYPDLSGARERWGRSVFHCPFCHGWEVRDRDLAVLGADEMAVHRVLLLRSWSDSVTLLSDGGDLAPDAAERLAGAGLVAAPCYRPGDVVTDPHVRARNMLVEIARPDGVDQPVLVAGNPIRMSGVEAPEEARPPYLGEHTSEVLGLDAATLASLRADGVIA